MKSSYTSTGSKLYFHNDVVGMIRRGYGTPVSLQMAPTSRCDLKCWFCSNINRTKEEDLEVDKAEFIIKKLTEFGLKTVEWTGGGEPTMYEHIHRVVQLCANLGLKQGLITNGTVPLSKTIGKRNLGCITWIRISMNCLDYIDEIEPIPDLFTGTLGFSYVMNADTTEESINRVRSYAARLNPAYVRIVPNCQATDEEQTGNNRDLKAKVDKFGHPFFYQEKTFRRPEWCYWGYFKPFVLHDGYVYPCSSVVLNGDSERRFHEKYRLYPIEEFPPVYSEKMASFDTSNCNHCVFFDQNAIVSNLLDSPDDMDDFI